MKTKLNLLTAGILGLVAIAMSGCQSTDCMTAGDTAVTCDKCKTVWVKRVEGPLGRSGVIRYRNEKAMECDDCENAVTSFFKTGSFKHHCEKCGGTMTHCENH